MDYDLQYDSAHRVLVVVMGRTVTKASSFAALSAVHRFIAAEGPCSVIADLSAIEIERVPGYFVRSLAWTPSAITAGNLLILVAPQTVIYGLSRMFHLWRGETATHKVVHTLEEGYALLGLEAPRPQVIGQSAATAGGPSA